MMYEELLSLISKSGPCYRWSITVLISFLSMKAAFDIFLLNLTTATVPFHCAEALVDNVTLPWRVILSNYTLAAPVNITDYQCSVPRFVTNPDGSLSAINGNDSTPPGSSDRRCEAWTFQALGQSMLTEYQLVCDRHYLNDRLQTVLQLGICLATLLGPIGDVVGRKPMLLLFSHLNLVCSLAAVFVTDLTAQMALRFLMGCGDPAQLMGLLLLTEIVSEEYRSAHGNLFWITWTLAYAGSAGVAYVLPNWRVQLGTVVAVTGVIYAAYIPALPESPRWLLTRGKTERASRELKRVCRYSGCEDAVGRFDFEANELVDGAGPAVPAGGLRSSVSIPRSNICRPVYLVTQVVVTLSFFTSNLVYHALCFQRDFIATDPYVNVAISGALELPAHVAAWPLINRIGRRTTTVASMCLTGTALVAMPFLTHLPGAAGLQSSLAVLAKLSSTVTYSVLNVYGAEVLPTELRSCSLFLAYSIMTVGQFLAPELGGNLAAVHPALPGLLYGGSTVLVGLLILLLPETRGRSMPNSVREMRPLNRCRCCCLEEQVQIEGTDSDAEGTADMEKLGLDRLTTGENESLAKRQLAEEGGEGEDDAEGDKSRGSDDLAALNSWAARGRADTEDDMPARWPPMSDTKGL